MKIKLTQNALKSVDKEMEVEKKMYMKLYKELEEANRRILTLVVVTANSLHSPL